MSHAIWKLIAVTMIISLVAACAPSQPTEAPAKPPVTAPAAPVEVVQPLPTTAVPAPKVKRGGTLRVADNEEWAPNLDPHQITSRPIGYEFLHDTLVRVSLDPKTGKRTMKPGLAESWEQTTPKAIVMKLRKDVVFHDGSKFNAEVAKWNLDRMLSHPKSAAKTDVAVIDNVSVVDEYTISINLKSAPAGILYRLSDAIALRPWIASKAAIERDGDEALTRRTVGSGSMQFVEWITGDRMTMKKWDKYWEKGEDGQPMPYVDGVVIRIIRDETVGITELRTGNIDVHDRIEPRSFSAIQASPDLELIVLPWIGWLNYIIFNVQKPPFDNLKLRQAAAYAIDRESIAKALGMGSGYPSYYYWGPGDLAYDETLPRYTYDKDKAKQLVKDAGFPTGVDITDDFLQTEPNPRTAQAMKQAWDEVGIRTTLNLMERTPFVSKLQVGNFQVANSLRTWGEADPEAYSYRLTSTGTFNFAHFENADMDKCMEEGRNTAEDAKRVEIYKRCQRIIFEQVPYDQVWFTPFALSVNKKVKGWEPHFFNQVMLRGAWIDR
ncbi:MAG: ABC transporter substrate-binding protein [Bacteroidetes bacterium]|nr:ABC transporter substrate-binding protein [Bacteroidota bacterium]MCL5025797.1 ABC transporter substrate-binding protein [Chloroflexota bacterium]